jgi:hypothetical protein
VGVYVGATTTVYAGISHLGTLEALTCREALDAADDVVLGSIHVASDCLKVIRGLEEGNMGSSFKT